MKYLKLINWKLLLAIVLIAAILPAGVIYAVVFTGVLTVANNTSTAYDWPQLHSSMNNTQIINFGYCDADMLDVLIKDTSGNVIAMLPTSDNGTWYTPEAISAYSYTSFIWSSENTPKTSHQIVIGNGGYIEVIDSASIELGDDFTVLINAYFNTASGSDKNAVIKPDGSDYAFKLYVSDTSEITASIDDGACEVTVSGLTSGEYEIKVIADGTNLYIYVDDTLEDSTALSGASVPDTADNLLINENNTCPWINEVRFLTVH